MRISDLFPDRCPECQEELIKKEDRSIAIQCGLEIVCECGKFSVRFAPFVYIFSEKVYPDIEALL